MTLRGFIAKAIKYHNFPMVKVLIEPQADPTSVPTLHKMISSDYSTAQTLDLIKLLLSYHDRMNEWKRLLLNSKDNKGRNLGRYLEIKSSEAESLINSCTRYKVRYCNSN
jgi:hypothetical protein